MASASWKSAIAMAAAVVFFGAPAAFADPAPDQPATSATVAPPQISPDGVAPGDTKADPNREVCRRVEQLGSRLRAHRICRTAAEWDVLDERARTQARRMQDRAGNVVRVERVPPGG